MKHFLALLPLLLIGTTVEAQSAGEALFMENCVACHGTGAGGWPFSGGVGHETRKPDRDRRAPQWGLADA